MGKNKLKQQLKRPQRDVLASRSTEKTSKKQKKEAKEETEVEIDCLSFNDAFSAGLAFEQLESFDGALAAFQRAVACQPSHLGALTHLADVYSAAGQPDEAIKCYVKACELEDGKKDASVWFRLGLAHAAMEQHLEATKAYKKSMKINVKGLKEAEEESEELKKAYCVTLAALAEAFGELGDLDSAVKVFEGAVAKFPGDANMHYNLANMRMARSVGESAFDSEVAKCLEQAIKLSPETRDFVEDLAAYLKQHDQQPERVRELKTIAEKLQPVEAADDDNDEDEEGNGSDEEEEGNGSDKEEDESDDDEED